MKNQTEKQIKLAIITTTTKIPLHVKLAVSLAWQRQRYSKSFSARQLRKLGINGQATKRAVTIAQELGLMDDRENVILENKFFKLNANGNPPTFRCTLTVGHPHFSLAQQVLIAFIGSLEKNDRKKPMNWTYIGKVIGVNGRTAKRMVCGGAYSAKGHRYQANGIHTLKIEEVGMRVRLTTSDAPPPKAPPPLPKPIEHKPAKTAKPDWKKTIREALAAETLHIYLADYVDTDELIAAIRAAGSLATFALEEAAEQHLETGFTPNFWGLAKIELAKVAAERGTDNIDMIIRQNRISEHMQNVRYSS